MSSRELVFGLLLLAMTGVETVRGQFAGSPVFFGNDQAVQPTTMGSQTLRATSNTTSTSSRSGSLPSVFAIDSASDGQKTIDDGSFSESLDGDGSENGDSWSIESGSASSSLEYGCDCRSVRRVSLMGASDYCLAPDASLSSKCGNVDLGESGTCPITGAQPCSPKGHVLANDSLCALDDKDETYKCVASKNDLEIQKKGKKKRKKSNRRIGSESSTSTASPHLLLTARQILAIVVCVAAGVMAVA